MCMKQYAHRATGEGYITVDNLEPNPKNPIIAAFFRNIGYADQLGSGVRNLFKYSKYYSGQEPEFVEGDISAQYRLILNYVKENKKITSHQAELLLKVKQRRAREILSKMTQSGMLKRQGAYRSTIYVMNDRM